MTALAAAQPEQAPPLLPLRQEIGIFPGPAALDGSPTWTLHDPTRNRFYRLGWQEFEILSRWEAGTIEAIVASIEAETTLRIEAADVEEMSRFLFNFDLLRATNPQATAHLIAKVERQKQSWATWLLHNYLFMRIPLVRPDAFLTATYPYIRWVFSRGVAVVIAAVGLFGLYGVARRWDAFLGTLVDLFTIQGAVWFAVTLAGMKVIHELGHAYTAKRFGCRVPTMGVALLVLVPMLYTDVNESWKLTSRRQRLAIGLAGVTTELCCAAIALCAWTLLPDGPARSAAFLVATSIWVTTLLINASPFMRFDGYYVLSDWLEMPNLHGRSFALAQWWMRKTLLGLADDPPEDLPDTRRNLLIVFAFLTWAYRLILFLGIAVLVYHFTIKIVGIALAVVEIGYFVAWPVLSELRVWWGRRGDMRWNRNTIVTAALAIGIVALVMIPWRSAIEAPGLLKSAQHVDVFVPEFGARVLGVAVKDRQQVDKGASLLRLSSPDLDYRLARAQSELEILEWQMNAKGVDAELLARSQVTASQYEASLAEYRGLADQNARLQMIAPIVGTVVDVAPGLTAGAWLPAKARLLSIVDPAGVLADAYIDEADLHRVAPGDTAIFIAEGDSRIEVPLRVVEVARASTRLLPEPYLASVHQGPISVRAGKQNELVPDRTIYRVRLVPTGPVSVERVLRGHVVLRGEPMSLAKRAWRAVITLVIRESGA